MTHWCHSFGVSFVRVDHFHVLSEELAMSQCAFYICRCRYMNLYLSTLNRPVRQAGDWYDT
jgi:hypothetical protein